MAIARTICEFFIDPIRCIGCQACVQACSECDTHQGHSMIHLEYVEPSPATQTVPVVCMHCEQPTCAEVCPADAIKRTGDGVVQTARKPRCIACGNCVLACPFGVPEDEYEDRQLMMKCDMCYDRTSAERSRCARPSAPARRSSSARASRSSSSDRCRCRPISFLFGSSDDHDPGVHDDARAGLRSASRGRRHCRDGRAAARARAKVPRPPPGSSPASFKTTSADPFADVAV